MSPRGLPAAALALALAVLAPSACTCPPPAQAPTTEPAAAAPAPAPIGDGRQLAVSPDHGLYARVEGTSFQNGCQADTECQVGGCSAEVCSAEPGVNTTCEVQAWPTEGASCGCVAGQCAWYRGDATAPGPEPVPTPAPAPEPAPAEPAAGLPGQAQPCDAAGHCAVGLTCVSYYGIAGPRGPKFTSCEIRCAKGACPDGQTCRTIADGPGAVCRP